MDHRLTPPSTEHLRVTYHRLPLPAKTRIAGLATFFRPSATANVTFDTPIRVVVCPATQSGMPGAPIDFGVPETPIAVTGSKGWNWGEGLVGCRHIGLGDPILYRCFPRVLRLDVPTIYIGMATMPLVITGSPTDKVPLVMTERSTTGADWQLADAVGVTDKSLAAFVWPKTLSRAECVPSPGTDLKNLSIAWRILRG